MAIAVVEGDINNVYGADNVRRWSQLNSDSEAKDAARITKSIDLATERVQNRFRRAEYDINFVAESGTLETVVNWIATIAGVWLFMTRGNRSIEDSDNTLSEKMVADEVEVMKQMDFHLAGMRHLQANRDSTGPSAPVVIL